VHILVPVGIRLRNEVVTVPHGLDEHKRAVQHKRRGTCEGELRKAEHGSVAAREVGQHERERHERGQRGQCRTRALGPKALLVVAHAADQQGETDHAVEDDHDRGEHRVSSQLSTLGAASEHDGDDQRHLDHRHGDGEHERTEWLADAVRHQFRMIDGRKHRGDEHDCRGRKERVALADDDCRHEHAPS
jgi:hypothetical protein